MVYLVIQFYLLLAPGLFVYNFQIPLFCQLINFQMSQMFPSMYPSINACSSKSIGSVIPHIIDIFAFSISFKKDFGFDGSSLVGMWLTKWNPSLNLA